MPHRAEAEAKPHGEFFLGQLSRSRIAQTSIWFGTRTTLVVLITIDLIENQNC